MPQWLRLIIAVFAVGAVIALIVLMIVIGRRTPSPGVHPGRVAYRVTAVVEAPPDVTLKITLRGDPANPLPQTMQGDGSLDFDGTCKAAAALTIEAAPVPSDASVDITPVGPQLVSPDGGSAKFRATVRVPAPPEPPVTPVIPGTSVANREIVPDTTKKPIEEPVERVVRVTVTTNGTAVGGAEVDPGSDYGGTALTGADGVAELTLQGLPSATVALTVTYMGQKKRASVRLATPSPSVMIDFVKETPFRVQVARGGQPLAGITITSTPGPGQAVTDGGGEAVIPLRLPRGTTIRFRAVVDGSEYTAEARLGDTPPSEPVVITVDNTIDVQYVIRATRIANAASGSKRAPLEGVEILARDSTKARLGEGRTDQQGMAKIRVRTVPGTMITWSAKPPTALPSDYRPEKPEWEAIHHHANPDEIELAWMQPEAPTGACCRTDASCLVGDEKSCTALHGTYKGDGTMCRPDLCLPPDNGSDDRQLIVRLDQATESGWNIAFKLLRCEPGNYGKRPECRTTLEPALAGLGREARSIQPESIQNTKTKVRAYLLLMLASAVEGQAHECDAINERLHTLSRAYTTDFEPVALLYRALARATAGVTSPATQHNEAVSLLDQAEQLPNSDDSWVIWQKQNYVKGVRAMLLHWFCQEQADPASCGKEACTTLKMWESQCSSDPDCHDNDTILQLKKLVCTP